MSPAKFHDDEHARREINGLRPSPLKINKESHLIHKSSSSSLSTNSSSSSSFSGPKQHDAATAIHQQRHPVIIYTHSPKIIHTQARDFMALVQKLTGLSRSDDETAPPQQQQAAKTSSNEGNNNSIKHDDNESSSVLTDENYGGAGGVNKASSSSISPMFNPPNPCFADIPLFTPNSTNFFCSPRPLYRYPDSVFVSPNMGNPISPSVWEFMKGLQEY